MWDNSCATGWRPCTRKRLLRLRLILAIMTHMHMTQKHGRAAMLCDAKCDTRSQSLVGSPLVVALHFFKTALDGLVTRQPAGQRGPYVVLSLSDERSATTTIYKNNSAFLYWDGTF
jgi:hypothetical protein